MKQLILLCAGVLLLTSFTVPPKYNYPDHDIYIGNDLTDPATLVSGTFVSDFSTVQKTGIPVTEGRGGHIQYDPAGMGVEVTVEIDNLTDDARVIVKAGSPLTEKYNIVLTARFPAFQFTAFDPQGPVLVFVSDN